MNQSLKTTKIPQPLELKVPFLQPFMNHDSKALTPAWFENDKFTETFHSESIQITAALG